MIKLNLALLLTLVISGLVLVYFQHENRLLFTAVSNEARSQTELETEKKHLVLEQQNLVTPTEIARNAASHLQMRAPSLGAVEYIPLNPRQQRDFEAQLPVDVRLLEQEVVNE